MVFLITILSNPWGDRNFSYLNIAFGSTLEGKIEADVDTVVE